jgi:hypothetical protein
MCSVKVYNKANTNNDNLFLIQSFNLIIKSWISNRIFAVLRFILLLFLLFLLLLIKSECERYVASSFNIDVDSWEFYAGSVAKTLLTIAAPVSEPVTILADQKVM